MELKNFFAQDDAGNFLSEATCYVYQRGTESLAGGLKKANGLAQANPFTTDQKGFAEFAAPNGLYDVRVVKDARDFRIRLQFNDVAEDVAAAQIAAHAAENFRDAAQLSAGIYDTTAIGLLPANTTSGEYFSVPSPDSNEYLILYKNNAGVAVYQDAYPNAKFVQEIDQRVSQDNYLSDDLMEFVDGESKSIGKVKKDASWDILLSTIKTAEGLEVYEYEALGLDADAVFVDAEGKILSAITPDDGSGKEVVGARGNRASLNDRVSQSLNAYGMPKHHVWGEWYLRETRQRLRKRMLGEPSQLTIAIIGDSWTHNADRYSKPVASTLKAQYGSAGDGWVGFGRANSALPNGNVSWGGAVTYAGAWDGNYATSYSPDIAEIYSSEVAASLKYTIPALTSAVNLFAKGGAGVVQYRWGVGAWTPVDLSALATGLQIVALASVPSSSSVIEVAVVSGTPVLFGLDVKSTSDGVRCHKLGATGSRSQQWTSVDQTQWVAGITSLAPNLFIIMHGTNDQAAYGPSAYQGYMRALIARCRLANPLADVLLMIPCENGRANTAPMSGFAEALYELAVEQKCAFMDLQYLFGDSFSEYASTSPRAWFNADLIHPEPQTGGRVIVDGVLRLLTQL